MLLGFLLWFGLLGELDHFNPIRAAITVVAGSAFLLMVLKDSQKHRMWFFYAFMAAQISNLVFGVMQAYEIIEDKNVVEMECTDMEKKGQWKVMLIKDMDECKQVVWSNIDRAVTFAIIITALLSLYFQVVVYTYWKNRGKTFAELEEEAPIRANDSQRLDV